MFVDVIIRCQIYFVFLIFVVRANHENILTTKISRSTVSTPLNIHVDLMHKMWACIERDWQAGSCPPAAPACAWPAVQNTGRE